MEVLSVIVGAGQYSWFSLAMTLIPSVKMGKALNSSVPHCNSKRQVLRGCQELHLVSTVFAVVVAELPRKYLKSNC